MSLFDSVPENFFSPLASPLRKHYAALLNIYYGLFIEFQGNIERLQIVSEFEQYFNELKDFKDIDVDDSRENGENHGKLLANLEASSREFASRFLRRLISYGWLSEETLPDFTYLINITSWAKPFFEAIYFSSSDNQIEYESHIIAVYSLLTGSAVNENGHYNVMNALYHTRLLIESLKVLSQNIKSFLQNLYDEEADVKDILHIHYDMYMHEVVDRAYTRLKTSDNLSKYRPEINHSVSNFLQDEIWLKKNANQLANVKRLSISDAYKQLIEMLKEIRDSLRSIDPILEEIDDKNRRYSRISTEKIKSKLYTDSSLQGKVQQIITGFNNGILPIDKLNHHLISCGFFDRKSLYKRKSAKKQIDKVEVVDNFSHKDLEYLEQEMLLKMENQLCPDRIAQFLISFMKNDTSIISAAEIVSDMESFIKLIYATVFAEGRPTKFLFDLKWKDEFIEVNDFRFRDHYYFIRKGFNG